MSSFSGTAFASSMEKAHEALGSLIRTMYGSGKLDISQTQTLEEELAAIYAEEDSYWDFQTDAEEVQTYLETVIVRFGAYPYAVDIVEVINPALAVVDDLRDQADLESPGNIAAEVLVESAKDAADAAKTTASILSNPWVVGAGVVAGAAILIIIGRAELRAAVRAAT